MRTVLPDGAIIEHNNTLGVDIEYVDKNPTEITWKKEVKIKEKHNICPTCDICSDCLDYCSKT